MGWSDVVWHKAGGRCYSKVDYFPITARPELLYSSEKFASDYNWFIIKEHVFSPLSWACHITYSLRPEDSPHGGNLNEQFYLKAQILTEVFFHKC